MDGHDHRPLIVGLALAGALAFGLPLLYFVHVIAQDKWLVAAALAIGGACGWRFSGAFGSGAAQALFNRRARDDARTRTMIEAQVRPALSEGREQLALAQGMAAASTSLGRAAAVWERMETGALASPTPAAWPPVHVWDQPRDDGGLDGPQ